ncbi:MFS transporter [Aeromicrobium sp. P5_D10]
MIAVVGLSLFATGMWTIVMVFQVLAVRDDPAALSAVAACLSAGLFLAAVPGGIVADRRSRRGIVIAVRITNTAAVTAVAILRLSDKIELWHLALTAFTLGAGSAFFYPAYSALLPTVLAPEEVPRAGIR